LNSSVSTVTTPNTITWDVAPYSLADIKIFTKNCPSYQTAPMHLKPYFSVITASTSSPTRTND
jgi:hypothetical protein